MARERPDRVTLIERVVTERLSPAGIDLLFDAAEVLSEGDGAGLEPGAVFYGSTMLTVSLGRLSAAVAEAITPKAMELLRRLWESDPRVRRRLVELARREASRLAGGRDLDACDVDVSFRVEALDLLVDLDVQATLAVPGSHQAA